MKGYALVLLGCVVFAIGYAAAFPEREQLPQVRAIESCFRNGGAYVSGPYGEGQRYIGCAGKPSDFGDTADVVDFQALGE